MFASYSESAPKVKRHHSTTLFKKTKFSAALSRAYNLIHMIPLRQKFIQQCLQTEFNLSLSRLTVHTNLLKMSFSIKQLLQKTNNVWCQWLPVHSHNFGGLKLQHGDKLQAVLGNYKFPNIMHYITQRKSAYHCVSILEMQRDTYATTEKFQALTLNLQERN